MFSFSQHPLGASFHNQRLHQSRIKPSHRESLFPGVFLSDAEGFVRFPCSRENLTKMSGMAEDLTKEQVQMLRKAFDMFDREKNGIINTNMVSTILRTLGQTFEEKDLKDLISEIDQDGSGELEFEEFMALAARFLVEEDAEAMQEELREAFRLYDKQGQGYINVSDLRDILRALDDKLTEDELDEMIAEIDTDGSGTVDFDEFMEMMTGE
ncbi:troponin C-like [Limulus polyphemus]|uniref:Troponin C-like n=1 Tax=Limulus polyphemus TaxID=6850 RepID=A0ABM1B924_LIMPO|nr:troponin C-like [Limulus polyphemus]